MGLIEKIKEIVAKKKEEKVSSVKKAEDGEEKKKRSELIKKVLDDVKSMSVKLKKGDSVKYFNGKEEVDCRVEHLNIDGSIDIIFEDGVRVNDVFSKDESVDDRWFI